MTDAEREFNRWFKREQRKGLKNLHVTFDEDTPPPEREDFYVEMNAINRAIAEGRCETLTFNDSSLPRQTLDEIFGEAPKCNPKAEEIINRNLFED